MILTLVVGPHTLQSQASMVPIIDQTDSSDIDAFTVYIPTIFSPNGDGVNDLFQIYTSDDHISLITRFYIFDRGGKNIYQRTNIPLHGYDGWWDGTYKRFTMSSGVYAYYLELEDQFGRRKSYRGDVTLIR
jgi:gliding motility-associated-like protein